MFVFCLRGFELNVTIEMHQSEGGMKSFGDSRQMDEPQANHPQKNDSNADPTQSFLYQKFESSGIDNSQKMHPDPQDPQDAKPQWKPPCFLPWFCLR